ncbi:hypothetical protein [Aquipuribacter hungaricus]|uniref:Uncharacterized protein n=1 Tax=Aquipuribacter hungaricus TaxID=545624 RepID=A0ABV7WBY5_9MICO
MSDEAGATTRPGPDEKDWHRPGPVGFRRGQTPTSTTDTRLLENRGEADWVHSDPWRSVTRAN